MTYDFLRTLLDWAEKFQRETGQQDIQSFAFWLDQQIQQKEDSELTHPFDDSYIDGQIAYALSMLNIHSRHYIKTALKQTDLVSIHDFGVLLSLQEEGDMRKTELIYANMLELSPGMEVVRRLLRHGFIEDFDDPDDRRSKRVRITAQGTSELAKISAQILKVSKIVVGNLTLAEKKQLLPILHKLTAYHKPIWYNDLGAELDSILEKYTDQPEE